MNDLDVTSIYPLGMNCSLTEYQIIFGLQYYRANDIWYFIAY